MDFLSFREQYDNLPDVHDRTALLLQFSEQAMQSVPGELAPRLRDCRDRCLDQGLRIDAALCDRLLGWIAVDRGAYDEALDHFHAAAEVFAAEQFRTGELKVLNGIASVHHDRGRFETALAVYRRASALAEELGDRDQATILLANIGETLLDLGQVVEAEQSLRKALEAGGLSPLNESLILNQLAAAYLAGGRPDDARAAIQGSLALARRGTYLSALAQAHDLLGRIERGDPVRAREQFEEALGLARQAGDRSSETQTLVHLGELDLDPNPGAALERFASARALARDIGARPLEAEADQGLYRANRALGRWQEALEALERHHQLVEEIHSDNANRQLAQVKAELARREVELYRDQSRILALLGELGQRITATLDLESVVMTVYQTIGELMKAESFGLGLYDDATGTIDYQLFVEDGRRIAPFVAQAGSESFSGWCVRHKADIRMGNVEVEYSRYIPRLPTKVGTNGKRTLSCLYTPLVAEGKVLGVLSAQSYQVHAFSERDLATLKTLAGSISIAVQNARLFEQITRLATVDGLTGAVTRRRLFERAEEEFQRFHRDGVPTALVMIDLDHFKGWNDAWGHAMGDQVLADFGRLLLAQKRPHDLFGRYGGEEFALVLSGTDLEGAITSAQRLCRLVRELPLQSPQGEPLQLTASFGVTVFAPSDVEITKVFSRADEALYEAKQAGRDRVVARTV